MASESRHVAEWHLSPESGPGRWSVGCELNELFRKHRQKIWRCRPLIERIVGRCKTIFHSRCFELEWIEIDFDDRGPGFQVEGDRCCLVRTDTSYYDHNVDTADQAWCLYLCLQAALNEIDNAISFWERGGETPLEELSREELFARFTKDLTKWGLYEVRMMNFREPALDRTVYVWATSITHVRKVMEEQPDLFGTEAYPFHEIREGPVMRLIKPPLLNRAEKKVS